VLASAFLFKREPEWKRKERAHATIAGSGSESGSGIASAADDSSLLHFSVHKIQSLLPQLIAFRLRVHLLPGQQPHAGEGQALH